MKVSKQMTDMPILERGDASCEGVVSNLETINSNLGIIIKHRKENPNTKNGKRSKGIMSEVLK